MFAFFTLIPLLQSAADAHAALSKPTSVKEESKRNVGEKKRFTSRHLSKTHAGKKAVVKC